ncbi:alpha/beta hydrolase [Costertonia aggregata]|uniref:Alpha/beta fold hydrolase n=1 Tax=Costertonia aggregata TaxID=343403 RepID=A0A7H9AU58_9FLAO|nr:alpha/beta fold hydrolase [Costertonia aggregata]QLG47031.1 alpha/beta fold hydrolase [Costertonia aggregata]
MRRFKKIARNLLIFYLLITVMLYFLQEKLIFLPSKLPQDYQYSFAVPHHEFNLTAPDGAVLNGLHFKGTAPKGVLLYFHGNAGDLSRWGEIAQFFVQQGYDVIIMDYRTYGKSTGKLSEAALHADAQLFYAYALKTYDEKAITLYGRSLGTGIATQLASTNAPKQLILETPYYSLVDVAKSRFPFLPVDLLMKYKLKSHEFMNGVTCPVVVFHGTDDAIVPYASGQSLYEAVPHAQKQIFTIKGGGHNNLIEFPEYLESIARVLK